MKMISKCLLCLTKTQKYETIDKNTGVMLTLKTKLHIRFIRYYQNPHIIHTYTYRQQLKQI